MYISGNIPPLQKNQIHFNVHRYESEREREMFFSLSVPKLFFEGLVVTT